MGKRLIQSARHNNEFYHSRAGKFHSLIYFKIPQLTSKKLPFAEFQCSIKEEYPQLFENAIMILPYYQLLICMKTDFLHTLQPKQQTECNRLNGEASERIQLSSNELDTEEIFLM